MGIDHRKKGIFVSCGTEPVSDKLIQFEKIG